MPQTPAWRPRAEALALELLNESGPGVLGLDIQRVFSWLPPERPAGEALFRLVEAFPRTPDRAGRVALVREFVRFLPAGLAPLALPFVALGTAVVGRQFVFAQDIEAACARGVRTLSARPQARFSFDMLGEGARTAADADLGQRRYAQAVERVGAVALGARSPARLGVSVKLSSIHPRFDAAGLAFSRREIHERLGALCRAAAKSGIGLTIDAEESERFEPQLELFGRLALDPAWLGWDGLGLALQAYRREASEAVDRVAAIARERRGRGGAPLTVRLVKGAYWDSEVKRAQELGLDDYPVFTAKQETDRSYAHCAARLLATTEALFPQFATHNPVSAACVLAMAQAAGVAHERFEMQRLHGMGAGLERALARRAPGLAVRVYAPVGGRRELLAYLVRRLLENGASTSFVRQAARAPDAAALVREGFAFLDGAATTLPPPRDLHMPERKVARGFDLGEPGTLDAIARQVAASRRHWRCAPLVEGKALAGSATAIRSPARPELAVGEVVEASVEQARAAVAAAHAARRGWGATPAAERAARLERLGELLEEHRHELMALCVWEAGKTLPDALADVREAIDFCRYYAAQARKVFAERELTSPAGERNVLTLHPRGVFACISPWNFPIAIFTGQVAAALVAGNTVVAKPAEQTPLAAFRIVELAHQAGIPHGALHLVPGRGETVGRALVEDARVAGVAFTGSLGAAKAINRSLAAREGPIATLIAETGGLNAMIVDSTALTEQVVDAVVASAFRSAGQRCSSLRMLYVQDEAYEQTVAMLKGAMAALRVGDPADPSTDIGPVIDNEARDALRSYVDSLREKAKLIAECASVPQEGSFLAPAAFEVGSIAELPGERFGPILHVARFAIGDLARVVQDVNATGFGLTMGVHTRLPGRADEVRAAASAGNLYVNRNMIGAVVGVQPFGGEGLSGTGPKAGGEHYLPRFANERVLTVNTAAAGGDLGLLTQSA